MLYLENYVQDGCSSTSLRPFQSWKLRLKARLQPRVLLDNPAVSWMMGSGLLGAAALARSSSRRLELLAAAGRRLDTPGQQALARRMLQPWLSGSRAETWRREKVGWQRYYGGISHIGEERALTTSLLLKEPGPNGEKGVLYCSFEFNWMKLIANHDARRFLRDYYLVGASSWSPGDHAVLGNFAGLSEDPVFIGISNPADMEQYRLYEPAVRALPIMACDWLDPADFHPRPHERRSIDLLMVSHTAGWKRHWLLFQALRRMRRDLNVVLIGRKAYGRGEKELMDEARAFGVKQDLTFLSNLEIDEVIGHQCDARVSVALSKREGSCVAVTEAMFADTPVGMMRDAHVGARSYINSQTGRLLSPGSMHRELSAMIEESGEYAPRDWACANIAAELTSARLNEILKRHSLQTGRPWTRGIAPLCWRYVPRYLHAADDLRLRRGVEKLRENYGIELKEFVSEKKAMRKAG